MIGGEGGAIGGGIIGGIGGGANGGAGGDAGHGGKFAVQLHEREARVESCRVGSSAAACRRVL